VPATRSFVVASPHQKTHHLTNTQFRHSSFSVASWQKCHYKTLVMCFFCFFFWVISELCFCCCRFSSSSSSSSSCVNPFSAGEQSAAAAPAGLKKKGPHIRPPFPWSTEYRAKNHSLEWILHLGISSIRGEVQCKRCDGMATVEVSLEEMFAQLDRYFMENKHSLHDRAPKHWMVPRLLDCTLCHQSDCVKPIIAEKKREINWLFLLLTQTLGLCTLDQLKFFCKHNDKHRTGAKDRVLYSTYGGLLKQLNPAGKYLPND
jgi:hypothetical protein